MFTPTVVKLLKHLRDNRASNTKEELASIIGEEQHYVDKALERLVAIDIVNGERGFYNYKATSYSENFCSQLIEVYDTLSKKPAKELFIRGLICQVPSQYLFRVDTLLEVLEQEGFDREEIEQFLAQEVERGYLRRLRVIYIGIEPYEIPICIPPLYFNYLGHLGIIDQGRYNGLKEEYKDYEFQGTDYIVARYPAELATSAKGYIERERKEVKEHLKRKGLFAWPGRIW